MFDIILSSINYTVLALRDTIRVRNDEDKANEVIKAVAEILKLNSLLLREAQRTLQRGRRRYRPYSTRRNASNRERTPFRAASSRSRSTTERESFYFRRENHQSARPRIIEDIHLSDTQQVPQINISDR